MADLFNKQRVLGARLINDEGVTMYNGVPVVGVCPVAESFKNNRETLGLALISDDRRTYNDQRVVGVVNVGELGGMFNNQLVIPVAFVPTTGDASKGGSLLFAGTETSGLFYGDVALGTDDFTVECWFWQKPGGQYARLFTFGDWPDAIVGFSLEDANSYFWTTGTNHALADQVAKYGWHHVAIAREGMALSCWLDGALVDTELLEDGQDLGSATLTLGNENAASANAAFAGYIADFRLVREAIYSGDTIEVPASPPSAADFDSSALLLLAASADAATYDSADDHVEPVTVSGVTWAKANPY